MMSKCEIKSTTFYPQLIVNVDCVTWHR